MNSSNIENFQFWDLLVNLNSKVLAETDLDQVIGKFNILFSEHLRRIKQEYSLGILANDEKHVGDAILLAPQLLSGLKINIRPFTTSCRSCIISDEEVISARETIFDKLFYSTDIETLDESDIILIRKYCSEIFYSIPYILKQVGLELFKPSEQTFVNEKLAEKLARAIHSRYSKLMQDLSEDPNSKKMYSDLYIVDDKNQQYFSMEYSQLPELIKSSNIDNAYHIPTKLLSIGYEIKECKFDEEVPLLALSESDVETMAMVEHIRWSWEKRLNGFRFAPTRNDSSRKHHCLVPYDDLPEYEKEKDRILVRMIPALLQDIGFAPSPLKPEFAESIKYSQRALAKVHHIKHNAENLFKGLNDFLKANNLELPPSLKELFEEIIGGSKEVGSGFSSAGTIQRTFLPSSLFFRECLPDSFLLYKPKDIVSGDFYFVAKKDNSIVYITADCTGHGIQGAMLSAICYNYIDQAVNQNNITGPTEILDNVMPRVEYLMRRSEGNIENKSGMELAVCKLHPTGKLEYAALNRPLYYFSSNQLNDLEPTKYREKYERIADSVKTQSIDLNHGDTVYTFSDGFADQFGGLCEMGERFKTKRFKELLSGIQNQSMTQQRETLNQTIEQWRQKSNQEQTDDIIVIGVKI